MRSFEIIAVNEYAYFNLPCIEFMPSMVIITSPSNDGVWMSSKKGSHAETAAPTTEYRNSVCVVYPLSD